MSRRVVFREALLCDGLGSAPRTGDLAVEDGRIVEVDLVTLGGASKRTGGDIEVIDARGLVLAPGFIDIHSHADFSLPRDPLAPSKLLQGVTTEVIGNCGMGLYPANPAVEDMVRHLAPMVFGETGAESSPSLRAYRERLEAEGVSVNVAPLVAHGNLRAMAMGMAERRPTTAELAIMTHEAAKAMVEGAFGLSTGLVYAPGTYAETDELVEVARAVAAYGGLYATHLRDEGSRLEQSVAEALEIGERAEISVQLSHHKAVGKPNWGKVAKTLAMVDEANRRGLDVHSDVYPYTAGASVLATVFLPRWAFEGSLDKLLERLADPTLRARMIRDAKAQLLDQVTLPGVLAAIPKRWLAPVIFKTLAKAMIINSVKRQRQHEGQSLAELAAARGKPLYEAVYDLLLEEDAAVTAIAHLIDERDVRAVLRHPRTMIGTDGYALREGKAHPRTYGTYPRVLERYVRGEGLLTLEDAIFRMTGLPAQKLGLVDRGTLAAGQAADLVLFDPGALRDRATFADPHRSPEGLLHVLVNGQFTVRDGEHTGARAGQVLRKAASPPRARP